MLSTLATFLLLPLVWYLPGLDEAALPIIMVAAYIATFTVCMVLTDTHRDLSALPNLITIFVAGAVGFIVLFWFAYAVLIVLGLAALARAWVHRLRNWPALSPARETTQTESRRFVDRYSTVATTLLVVVTSLLNIGFVV